MLELYGFGPSRWVKPYWMLKELAVEFKEQPINFSESQQRSPQFRAMNPFAKVPVLKDGDVCLFESLAIVNYLGEKYPEAKLTPKSGTLERAQYDQWISFCVTELEQPLWRMTKHLRILPEDKRIPEDVDLAKSDFSTTINVLDEVLGQKKFLVGNRFTAADITMCYTMSWAKMLGLEIPKNCSRYHSEITARPSFPSHLYQR